MAIDSFFSIGKSHKVCEDYAICINDASSLKRNVIAISDGCSSSKDSDFGSRILLKSLEVAMQMMPEDKVEELLTFYVWDKAVSVVAALGMPVQCLDATINLGYSTVINGIPGIKVICAGDGFVVGKIKSGGFTVAEIEFDKNAPYYMSYVTNNDRKTEFIKVGQKKTVTLKEYDNTCVLVDEWVSDTDENKTVDKFSTLWFPTDVYSSVSVFSDGLKTFIPHDQSKPKIPLEQVIKELTDNFPVTNGDFVKRRCLKFMKNHVDSAFYDDFSMATYVRD